MEKDFVEEAFEFLKKTQEYQLTHVLSIIDCLVWYLNDDLSLQTKNGLLKMLNVFKLLFPEKTFPEIDLTVLKLNNM